MSSLVPSISEVTTLFYTPDYPPDFRKTLPPLPESCEKISSSDKYPIDNFKGMYKILLYKKCQFKLIRSVPPHIGSSYINII